VSTAPDVVVLTVAYDGTPFAGFQAQPGLETVQGRLEEALATVLGTEISLTCAGRTDAGVHARAQVVSFPATGREPEGPRLLRSLNALAGPHVAVREVRRARPPFDARHSATSRRYRYLIVDSISPPIALRGRSWWAKRVLDADAMRGASRALLGRHDFTSFCVAESAREQTTVREIDELELERVSESGEDCLALTVQGRSFLHSMVRVIAGSLVEIGKGRRDASWLGAALRARDRAAAGPTAPAEGLTLWAVGYPDDVWL
jgi:tRNA pseudouridine38-40 synthase